MNKHILVAVLAFMLGVFLSPVTFAGPFEDAMNAALKGPEQKKIKIFDHYFNVKPVEILREGSTATIVGHISHHLSWRPDDQVYYVIVKEKGVIKHMKVDINRGGFAPIAAPIISSLTTYYGGVAIPPDQIESVGRSLGRVIDKNWEGASQFLIANIALRAN